MIRKVYKLSTAFLVLAASPLARSITRATELRGERKRLLAVLTFNVFSLPQGMRPDQGIPKVTVLLTDGYSNGRAVGGPARQLRNLGVNIFSIGVGHYVNPAELNAIASDPDNTHVFRLNSFNDLSGWVDKLSAVSCDGKFLDGPFQLVSPTPRH